MITRSLLEKQLSSWTPAEFKTAIGRERLRFSKTQAVDYLWALAQQHLNQTTMKALWLAQYQEKLRISYEGFMKNVQVWAKLWPRLFRDITKSLGITSSPMLNIIDSTLLPVKTERAITQKDWSTPGRVVSRTQKNSNGTLEKRAICGWSGLTIINRQGQISHAQIDAITTSDANVLKQPFLWLRQNIIRGLILADKGFSNKTVRERLDAWKSQGYPCRLVSPYHAKSKEQLTDKEWRLYRLRWFIETVFQKLKDPLGPYKLMLRGAKTVARQHAQFFISLTAYNLANS